MVAEVKGTTVTDYVRGINLICTDTDYYLYNAHGDVVSLTSTSGVITKTYDYDAFGNETNQSSIDTNPFRYCGEYYDTETGTYYLRARYYNPSLGRFGTEDPAYDGLNWYTYCAGNPVYYSDYTGLFLTRDDDIWSFKSDVEGQSILFNWLFGNGDDFIAIDGMWGDYMKDNDLLREKVKEIVLKLADDLKNDESKNVDITTSMEIQNGEDIIGYQYLHGTNADVGGFQIKGSISKNKEGDITYDLTYTWNDIIDPNFIYDSDSKKAAFAKKIPFANPTDYTIRISWTDKTIIKSNETWYNRSRGWLSK